MDYLLWQKSFQIRLTVCCPLSNWLLLAFETELPLTDASWAIFSVTVADLFRLQVLGVVGYRGSNNQTENNMDSFLWDFFPTYDCFFSCIRQYNFWCIWISVCRISISLSLISLGNLNMRKYKKIGKVWIRKIIHLTVVGDFPFVSSICAALMSMTLFCTIASISFGTPSGSFFLWRVFLQTSCAIFLRRFFIILWLLLFWSMQAAQTPPYYALNVLSTWTKYLSTLLSSVVSTVLSSGCFSKRSLSWCNS